MKSILLEGRDVGNVPFNVGSSKIQNVLRGLMLLEDVGHSKVDNQED